MKKQKVIEDTIPKEIEDELLKLVEKQKWTNAKTYEKTAPHEYFIIKDNKDLFIKLSEYIKKYGKYEIFKFDDSETKNRYLYLGGYRYWHYSVVMNRTKTNNIIYKDGVSRQVIK